MRGREGRKGEEREDERKEALLDLRLEEGYGRGRKRVRRRELRKRNRG